MVLLSVELIRHRTEYQTVHMPRSRKFFQRGSKFDNVFFLVDKGMEDTTTTINGPSLDRQRNTIEMAFHWWADDGPTLGSFVIFQGIRTIIAKKHYIFL